MTNCFCWEAESKGVARNALQIRICRGQATSCGARLEKLGSDAAVLDVAREALWSDKRGGPTLIKCSEHNLIGPYPRMYCASWSRTGAQG